ncbi:MAG: hypothetical protein SNJ50_20140, partial [Cyanobacteriota bacterium]
MESNPSFLESNFFFRASFYISKTHDNKAERPQTGSVLDAALLMVDEAEIGWLMTVLRQIGLRQIGLRQ